MKRVIDCLNVGFGESTVIRLSGEEGSFCLAVDAGDIEAGGNQRRCGFGQYLLENMIKRIDVLVLTHFHRDHIGGAHSVIGTIPIGLIIVHIPLPEQLLRSEWEDYSSPIHASLSLYIAIMRRARELGIPVQVLDKNTTLSAHDVEFDLLLPGGDKLGRLADELHGLHPAKSAEQEDRLSRIDRMLNGSAMAVLIRCRGQAAALLTSDVGLDFWEPYLAEIGHVQLVQAPHHGDARSISGEWLRALSPEYVIVSADDEGTYGLPHSEFADMVREHSSAKLLYTESLTTAHRIIRFDLDERELKLME